MQVFSNEAFADMAAARRASDELPFIAAALRERGDPLACRLSDAVLEREIRATLAACDRLGLASDIDRLGLCMLEITRFAGLRDLPRLKGLLDYAGGPPDARMQALLATMPPKVWMQLAEQAGDVRASRGLE